MLILCLPYFITTVPPFFKNLQPPFYQSCPCSYIVFQLQATVKQQSPDQIKQTKDKQQQQRPQWFGSTKARSNRQDLSDCTVWPCRRCAAGAPRHRHEPIFQNEAFNVLPLCNLYVYCTTQWGQSLHDNKLIIVYQIKASGFISLLHSTEEANEEVTYLCVYVPLQRVCLHPLFSSQLVWMGAWTVGFHC